MRCSPFRLCTTLKPKQNTGSGSGNCAMLFSHRGTTGSRKNGQVAEQKFLWACMNDDERILALLKEAQELEERGAKSEAAEKAAQAAELLSNCYRGFVVGLCRSRLSLYLGRDAATEIAEDIAHDMLLYIFR